MRVHQMSDEKGITVIPEVSEPLYASASRFEPEFFPLDTPDNCLECIARATWSMIAGELDPKAAKMAIDAASSAAKILNQTSTANSYAASVLASFAVPDPGYEEVVNAEIIDTSGADGRNRLEAQNQTASDRDDVRLGAESGADTASS